MYFSQQIFAIHRHPEKEFLIVENYKGRYTLRIDDLGQEECIVYIYINATKDMIGAVT